MGLNPTSVILDAVPTALPLVIGTDRIEEVLRGDRRFTGTIKRPE